MEIDRQKITREQWFAMVWARPAQEVAKELGVSDVAIGKLCARLQVPKPPRGYWARVQAGATPRRPPLRAFRDELERQRRENMRSDAAAALTALQRKFYEVAVAELKAKGGDVTGTELRGGKLPEVSPDVASQLLLLVQNRAREWVEKGTIPTRWVHSVESSASGLVERLLPIARNQILIFKTERCRGNDPDQGPIVLVWLTARLQQRISTLVRIIREQKLLHLVMPLMAPEYAWSARHLHRPASSTYLESSLCISATDIWVECLQRGWRDEDPPQRFTTAKQRLSAVMPVDYILNEEMPLPPMVTRAVAQPFRKRLDALIEAERVHAMLTEATYSIDRAIPDEKLSLAERIWFGEERPFLTARRAWTLLEDELERWQQDLDAESVALVRLQVDQVGLYASGDAVSFHIYGTRFRRDGTLGKLREQVYLSFEGDKPKVR
jgi:hypothetical protein